MGCVWEEGREKGALLDGEIFWGRAFGWWIDAVAGTVGVGAIGGASG